MRHRLRRPRRYPLVRISWSRWKRCWI